MQKDTSREDEKTRSIEFLDKNGIKTTVMVFEGETDEEALERARNIDARLGNENTF